MAVEEKIGVVTDYLNRIGVAVIWLTDGDVRRGDQVRIAGRTTELTQAVESLEIDHRPVEEALRGSEVAMKIGDPVRRHDQVFRIRDRVRTRSRSFRSGCPLSPTRGVGRRSVAVARVVSCGAMQRLTSATR
jgi:hypothetical protein